MSAISTDTSRISPRVTDIPEVCHNPRRNSAPSRGVRSVPMEETPHTAHTGLNFPGEPADGCLVRSGKPYATSGRRYAGVVIREATAVGGVPGAAVREGGLTRSDADRSARARVIDHRYQPAVAAEYGSPERTPPAHAHRFTQTSARPGRHPGGRRDRARRRRSRPGRHRQTLPVYRLDNLGGDHTAGCVSCNACTAHAAHKYFASVADADLDRAHPYCKCRVVQGRELPYASGSRCSAYPGSIARGSVDVRTPWVAEVLDSTPAAARPRTSPAPARAGAAGAGQPAADRRSTSS